MLEGLILRVELEKNEIRLEVVMTSSLWVCLLS